MSPSLRMWTLWCYYKLWTGLDVVQMIVSSCLSVCVVVLIIRSKNQPVTKMSSGVCQRSKEGANEHWGFESTRWWMMEITKIHTQTVNFVCVRCQTGGVLVAPVSSWYASREWHIKTDGQAMRPWSLNSLTVKHTLWRNYSVLESGVSFHKCPPYMLEWSSWREAHVILGFGAESLMKAI